MSGGSYNYLYSKDIDALVDNDRDIEEMADRLAKLGYAKDAASETYVFLLTLRQFVNRLSVIQKRLSDVWKAVEYWDSGDVGEDAVHKALEKYRGGKRKAGKEENDTSLQLTLNF